MYAFALSSARTHVTETKRNFFALLQRRLLEIFQILKPCFSYARVLNLVTPFKFLRLFVFDYRSLSIYQYSNMVPRLSGQTSIFGVVFFVSKSLLGIERQKKLKNFTVLTKMPRSHVRI